MRILALMCALALACGDDDTTTDAGTDAGADSATDSGGMVSDDDAVAIDLALQALAASAALAGPLVPEGEMLRDDSRLDSPDMREDTARERVESGVSGNSIVTDETCVGYAWAGLMVTITFTDCVMEATGEPLTGMLTLGVALFPTQFNMTFTDLQIGALGLDGNVSLLLGGGCREGDGGCAPCRDVDPECAEMRANQQTLSADLTIESGTTATLAIEGMEIVYESGTGATVNGTAEITSPTSSGTLTGTDVHWNPMECLPSSGTLTYDSTGPTTTVEFQATTPTTGNVLVTIPPFPQVETMLFEACPT